MSFVISLLYIVVSIFGIITLSIILIKTKTDIPQISTLFDGLRKSKFTAVVSLHHFYLLRLGISFLGTILVEYLHPSYCLIIWTLIISSMFLFDPFLKSEIFNQLIINLTLILLGLILTLEEFGVFGDEKS